MWLLTASVAIPTVGMDHPGTNAQRQGIKTLDGATVCVAP